MNEATNKAINKLTPTQRKLYDRIMEVLATKKEDEWNTSADIQSAEFGWNLPLTATVKAIARAGLINARDMRSRVQVPKTYQRGRHTNWETCVDKHFQFQRVQPGAEATFEHWTDSPPLGNHKRTDKYCNDTYWVL